MGRRIIPPKMTELYISDRMRGKMKGFSSLNTNPLTNDFCMKMNKNEKAICSHCYSITGLQTWCMGADAIWQRNGMILSKELLKKDKRPFIMPITNTGMYLSISHTCLKLNEGPRDMLVEV